MKNKLLVLASAICLPIVAEEVMLETNSMYIKQKNGNILEFSIADIEEVFFGNVDIGTTNNIIKDGHECVDLGLTSGNLWATCNVGANSPSEWGKYYAWGDTITKAEYSSTNCPTFGKTNAQLDWIGFTVGGNLDSEYDVAQHNWGGQWKMPTRADFQELINECTWTWTRKGDVDGYEIKSKQAGNSNSIFLPASGSKDMSDIRNQGSTAWYWTSTPYSGNDYLSWCLSTTENDISVSPLSRRTGFTIRAIYVEK